MNLRALSTWFLLFYFSYIFYAVVKTILWISARFLEQLSRGWGGGACWRYLCEGEMSWTWMKFSFPVPFLEWLTKWCRCLKCISSKWAGKAVQFITTGLVFNSDCHIFLLGLIQKWTPPHTLHHHGKQIWLIFWTWTKMLGEMKSLFPPATCPWKHLLLITLPWVEMAMVGSWMEGAFPVPSPSIVLRGNFFKNHLHGSFQEQLLLHYHVTDLVI